jgi:hypothetical protein
MFVSGAWLLITNKRGRRKELGKHLTWIPMLHSMIRPADPLGDHLKIFKEKREQKARDTIETFTPNVTRPIPENSSLPTCSKLVEVKH